MSDEEILKWIREGIQNAIKHGELSNELMLVWIQLKLLDKLDDMNLNIVDIEKSIQLLFIDKREKQ